MPGRLLLICGLALPQAIVASEQDWRRRFLDDAPRKWKEYVTTVRHYSATWEERFYSVQESGNKTAGGVNHFHIKRNATHDCTLMFYTRGTGKMPGMCWGENEKYALELMQEPGAERWMLKKLALDKNTQDYRQIKRLLDSNSRVPCPFLVWEEWLPTWIAEKRLQMEKVELLNAQGCSLLKIWFTNIRQKESESQLEKGWFIVDPDNWWRVIQYDIVRVGGQMIHGTFEFTSNAEGVPLLNRRMEERKWTGEDGKKHQHISIQQISIEAKEFPVGDFTLSAFGLPEPQGITWASGSRRWLWFVGAGVICVALVVFVSRHMKKTAKAGT